ncbi:MAG: NfeD family protein, partial [Acidobacteriota bacterium]
VRSQTLPPATGPKALVGLEGEAITCLDPTGKVLVRGEYYDARSVEPVAKGREVRVLALEGRKLKVCPCPTAGEEAHGRRKEG